MSMELIDKDKIKYLSIPIAPVLVGEDVHYEMGALKEWIDDMPTVEAIPLERVKQIREHFETIAFFNGTVKADYVLRVLDKAIKEVEQ